jgi:tRNA-Thr(GGU) m(6)t(6)A37 methyltransferase TsaA
MEQIVYEPIGTIHTPFKELRGMPIQPSGAKDVEGWVDVEPRYEEALTDLEGFSHIFLIYHLHESHGYSLRVVPFLDTVRRGLFSTRAPRRPNPIGLSVVRLDRVEGNRVYVRDVDMLDGTPLLDIKPCVREFDIEGGIKIGWLEGKARRASDQKSGSRFSE